jgi:hypothetical protein
LIFLICEIEQTEEYLLAFIGREGLLDLLLAVFFAPVMMLMLPTRLFCGALLRDAHLIDQFRHCQLVVNDLLLDNSILL